MNSEELELSLRTEFENYLKSFRAEMREHAAELHRTIEAEMDKHRSLLDEAFQAYAARFDAEHALDEGFNALVVEHLKQARDEGASVTASAMDEAAQMDKTAAAPADFGGIRDAIADISRHKSQSAILKALVEHASHFAPRGAFFIVKNEHLVGWKVFGSADAEGAVREIHFPLSSDSILSAAIRSLSTADGAYGAHENDAAFLEPLHFGHPDRMHAIPLVARGRGVAVLYADYSSSGTSVNVEALEALVRIAALTVELLASTQTARVEHREVGPADFESFAPAPAHVEEARPEVATEAEPVTDHEFRESAPAEEIQEVSSPFEAPAEVQTTEEAHESPAEQPAVEEETVTTEFQADKEGGEIIFDAGESPAVAEPEASPFDKAADFEPAGVGIGGGKKKSKKKETGVELSPVNVGRVGLGARTVDLPIDVEEEERRPHNDARRFARLLVSEIKLYNEQKVQEGRESGDLYTRLRESIDRSREMYDKRVQPPVAERFDYFHYELVNALADGNSERLGPGYPGASV